MKGFRFLFLFLVLALLVSGTILVGTKTIPHASAANSNGKSTQIQNAGLAAISAVSATNIWAVGSYYDSTYTEHALIEHWNGSQWSVVPAATSARGTDALVAVKAISSTNVWAIGSSGSNSSSTPLIEHWNGSAWSSVPGAVLPAGSVIHGLAVVASKDIWIVGDAPNAPYGAYVVTEHWDGTQWSSIQVAANTSYYSSLRSVTAIASNNVWAVGSTVNTQTNDDTLIEHWDGAVWSIVPSPGLGFDYLSGVTATSAKDIWAVGNYGGDYNYGRLVEHWNGTTWSIVKSPTYPGLRENYIASAASNSTTNAWLVGVTYFRTLPEGFAEHWNGIKWSVVPVAHTGPNTTVEDSLTAVTTITSSNVWAVGSQNYSTTLIEHWNGSQWQIVPSP